MLSQEYEYRYIFAINIQLNIFKSWVLLLKTTYSTLIQYIIEITNITLAAKLQIFLTVFKLILLILYFTDFRSIRNFYLMQLGGKFELRCGIQSRDPNFEVIWLKDGQVFNPQRSRGVSFANGNSKIVFTSLHPEDAGFYTCISGGRRYFSRLYMKNPIQQGQFIPDFKSQSLNTMQTTMKSIDY